MARSAPMPRPVIKREMSKLMRSLDNPVYNEPRPVISRVKTMTFLPVPVSQWTKEKSSEDVANQVQEGRQAKIAGRGDRGAAWDDLRTGLDERDVDIEDVVEHEEKTQANDEDEEIGKGPARDAILARDDVSAFLTLLRERKWSLTYLGCHDSRLAFCSLDPQLSVPSQDIQEVARFELPI